MTLVCYLSIRNTRRSPNAGSMLGHRVRRWPDIEPVFVQRMLIAEGSGDRTRVTRITLRTSTLSYHHILHQHPFI